MVKITIEAWPWLSELLGGSRNRRYIFDVEIEEDATLEALLAQLAEGNDRFRAAIYKPGGKELSGYLSAVINGRLPELLEGNQTRLQEGDRVVMVQGFAGG